MQLPRWAFLYPLNPAFAPVPHPAVKQDAEFARNIRDHVVIIVGKECGHNIEKLLNHANVVFVLEYIYILSV